MSRLLDAQVALITGAGSGIGRAAALAFAREGARVLAADLDEAGLAETSAHARAAGFEISTAPLDVADERAVGACIEALVARAGRLDCAFNNAGISDATGAFESISAEAWNRMLAVNLSGVYWCMKHEVRQMKTQPRGAGGMRGVICNTSSGAGIIAAPGLPHYTAAKHGVLGLTKAAAQELYGAGIRVNAICPGMTDSKMTRAFAAEDNPRTRAVLQALPGGAMGKPEDVAEAALWLCSPRARWVAGEALLVDGGAVSR